MDKNKYEEVVRLTSVERDLVGGYLSHLENFMPCEDFEALSSSQISSIINALDETYSVGYHEGRSDKGFELTRGYDENGNRVRREKVANKKLI